MKHIKTLLERGFLPISVDYRLCPEVNLAQGPMTDACDALIWARSKLPHLQRTRPDIQLDVGRVAAVGWSSGGQLAMTLAYTAPAKGILPPNTVLAFYCPSNFEAECTYFALIYCYTASHELRLINCYNQGGRTPSILGRSRNRQIQSTIFWRVFARAQ